MRALRRGALRDQRRRERMHQRWHRGQTLIIFALSITVLLGLAGLTIDIARAYDLYARMQRAAEAGASAGVLYLPLYYSTARTPGDGLSAVNRASVEIVKNGFGAAIPVGQTDCPSPPSSVEVAICQVPGQQNDLEVIITEQVSLVLATGLGLAPITLTTKAQAEYLPSVQLGSRSNFFGDEVECSASNPADPSNASSCDVGGTGAGGAPNHLQYYMATMNGPGELKEMGDPMVYCEEGNSNSGVRDGSANSYTDYNGYATNNPVWSSTASVIQKHCGAPVLGGNPGNPDQQPPGYAGPATSSSSHPGGYNYEVIVPSDGASLWVFNPTFIATNHNYLLTGEAARGLDLFFNQLITGYNSMQDPFGGGIATLNGHYDAPPFYFTMTYTVYKVTNILDRDSDTQVSTQAYPPYDAIDGDLTGTQSHGCSPGQIYDPYYAGGNTKNSYHPNGGIDPAGGCFTLAPKTQGTPPTWETTATAPCWLAWCMLDSNLTAGTYRLVVEATGLSSNVTEYHSSAIDGWGTHYYALKVCSTSAISSPVGNNCTTGGSSGVAGVSLAAWNNMDINFTTSLSSAAANASNPATSCVTGAIASPYACLDLACIPASYAGRTLTVGLYDPGDGRPGGDIYMGIVAPSGSGATIGYPSWVSAATTNIDGESVVQARFTSPDYNSLNGLWLSVLISLPPTYAGTCVPGGTSTGWFQIVYISTTGGSPIDWVGISFNLIGSPVHLVLPT